MLDIATRETSNKETKHLIDFALTIKDVMQRVKGGFPHSLKDCQESDYMSRSRSFVSSLVVIPEKLEQILKTVPSQCDYCNLPLIDWIHKGAKSYFLSVGHLREINIVVKICSKCKRAYYPDFYQNGLLFLHNKFLITIEAILDLSHVLQTGGSSIEVIKKKLLLLGQLEGLDMEALKKDLTNTALKLEKTVIAVMSLLLKGSDLDDVVCFICGIAPKIVCTDGNTKVIYVHNLHFIATLGPIFIVSLTENLASLILQYRVTKWHYY